MDEISGNPFSCINFRNENSFSNSTYSFHEIWDLKMNIWGRSHQCLISWVILLESPDGTLPALFMRKRDVVLLIFNINFYISLFLRKILGSKKRQMPQAVILFSFYFVFHPKCYHFFTAKKTQWIVSAIYITKLLQRFLKFEILVFQKNSGNTYATMFTSLIRSENMSIIFCWWRNYY